MGNSLNIMIVEDEPLIAMMLEDFLVTLGHEVVECCETIEEAEAALSNDAIQFAILDVNIGGEPVWPIAQKLRERGIPFALATGGHVTDPPSEFAATPTLAKPYTIDRIAPLIGEAMAAG